MVAQDRLTQDRADVDIDGVDVSIAMLRRTGSRPPVIFLHGFGSTKELAEIEHSGHWPVYANPMAMRQAVAQFLDRSETEQWWS